MTSTSAPDAGDPTDAGGGDAEEAPLLRVTGTPLTEEEQAAVAAVVGRLAGAEPAAETDHGRTGPRDRTLERRRRLGLWPRPGLGSWLQAGGLR
ncbi:acyl-CoA carboxylase epsilon subunit [Nesterenkonia sp. F]|uniref:acyl-CoA carboxylase epsilon subunit n=1 Tax=Nesterenkonia sp. F TaxID=795955 RepID=UPI000255CF8C|nr:acyl-CoA carboxylase epsilon subunit [Nesterenkonia sp. F]